MALNASSTVGFAAGGGKSLSIEEDNSPALELEDNESAIRVYPAVASAKVTLVFGKSIRKAGTGIAESIEEFLTFSGGNAVAPSKAPIGLVTITLQKFHKVSVAVWWDPDSGHVRASSPAYGIVKVRYTTAYDRYIAVHNQGTCIIPTDGDGGGLGGSGGGILGFGGGSVEDEEDTTDRALEPVYVVAEATGYEPADAMLSGPGCNGATDNPTGDANPYRLGKVPYSFVIESDPKTPVGVYSTNHNWNSGGFSISPHIWTRGAEAFMGYVGTVLRIYPADEVSSIQVINGNGQESYLPGGTRQVAEVLSFSGSHNANLGYIPNSSISVTRSARAISLFNQEITVYFRQPGERVMEVEWIGPSTYRFIRAYTVRDDEVVTTTFTGALIPCTTVCSAIYASDYMRYDVTLDQDSESELFLPASVFVRNSRGDRMSSYQIDPPGINGVL